MKTWLKSLACCFCLCICLKTPAAPGAEPSAVYPNDSDMAETLLRTATANEADKQWSEAGEIYRKVLAEFGDRAIRAPEESRREKNFLTETNRWVSVRELIMARQAAWPAEGRDAYRQRADAQAGVLWNRATDPDGDPKQATADLKRLASEYYLSSFGDKALERLGDLAFQAGQFVEASQLYANLVKLPNAPANEPGFLAIPAVHPWPSSSPAVLSAKLILARYAAGRLKKNEQVDLIKAYAEKFPQATGAFAGRTGPIAASLARAMTEDGIYLPPPSSEDWPTFAGDPARNRVVEEAIGLGARQWRVSVEPITAGRSTVQGMQFQGGFGRRGGFIPRNMPVNPNRNNGQPLLAYHPIVVDDQVIICNDRRISAFNLNEAAKPDGSVGMLWRQEFEGPQRGQGAMISSAGPRMTLTARNGRIYARMGDSGVSLDFGNRMNPSNAFLVALDARNKGQVLWRVASHQIPLPHVNDKDTLQGATLEGTPVADDRRIYVVVTLSGPQTSTYVAALSAVSGEILWVKYLFDAPNPFNLQAAMMGYQANHAHHLLTLAEDQLFYQSDSGAVASLEPESGQLRWLTAYSKRDDAVNPGISMTSRRDLNPAIFADGMVYVAPADSPHLFALEASSGALKWKSAPLPDVVHLVGVSGGNLFATGDRAWTLEAATGKIVRSWPDTGSGYEPAGRGLMAGTFLYWPTANEIHILDQKTGLRSTRGSIRLKERFQTSGGNLVLGDGYLVVAGTDNLSVFTQNTKLIRRYEQMIAASPDTAAPRYRLATVAESLNETKIALDALRAALERVKPEDRLDGQELATLITDRLYRLLLQQAGRAKSPDEALTFLAEAAERTPDPVKKQAVMVMRAHVLIEKGEAPTAFRELAELAARPTSTEALWAVEPRYDVNLAQRARLGMMAAWGKMNQAQKNAVHTEEAAAFEKKNGEGIDSTFPAFLMSLSPGLPAARGRLAWAKKSLSENDPARALNALAEAENEPGLDGATQAAIDALKQPILARSEEQQSLPLTRWSLPGSAFRTYLAVTDDAEPAGKVKVAPALTTMVMSVARDGKTQLISAGSGLPLGVNVPELGKPAWAGVVSGRGVVFDGSSLAGLDLNTGESRWRLPLAGQAVNDQRNSPFAGPTSEKPDQAERAQASPNPVRNQNPEGSAAEAGWWLISARQGRLLVQNQEGHLWRVDPIDGRVLWHRLADAPNFGFAFLIGSHVLMRDGSAIFVLDADSGVMTKSMDPGTAGTDWSREPMPWDENHVILSPDRLNVTMIDLNRGERVWTWQATPVQPRNGPPRYFRHGENLLVIADGETAVRLNPKSGDVLWRSPLGDVDYSREDRDVALDDQRLYLVGNIEDKGVTVRALGLADGSPVWRTVAILSGKSWRVSRSGLGSGMLMIGPDDEFQRRLAQGIVQSGDSGEPFTSRRVDEIADRSAAVLIDAASGRVRQRLVSPASASALTWTTPDWINGWLYMGGVAGAGVSLVEFGDQAKKVGSDTGKNR